jgi:hypothetical protein
MFIRALMEGIMPYLVEGERTMNTVAGFGMKKAKYTHTAMRICGEEVHFPKGARVRWCVWVAASPTDTTHDCADIERNQDGRAAQAVAHHVVLAGQRRHHA